LLLVDRDTTLVTGSLSARYCSQVCTALHLTSCSPEYYFCFFSFYRFPYTSHNLSHSSSLACSSYSLTIASFKIIAHSSLSFSLFLHLLTPNAYRSSSTQSSHLNFGLPGFLLTPGLPRTLSSPSFHQPMSQNGQTIPIFLLLWV
jgi:hypothetical protein